MASLLDKARLFVNVQAHGILDKLVNMDDVGAVRQYVREVQESVGEAREAKAVAIGNRDTAVQDLNRKQERIDDLNENIDLILGDDDDSNDNSALLLQTKLEGQLSLLEIQKGVVEASEKLVVQITNVEAALSAKYESMRARLIELETLSRVTAAQNSSAKSVTRAAGVLSDDADGDIDDVAARIRKENNISSARLDQAMQGAEGGVEKDVALARAKKAIEARKQALQAAKQAPVGSTTT